MSHTINNYLIEKKTDLFLYKLKVKHTYISHEIKQYDFAQIHNLQHLVMVQKNYLPKRNASIICCCKYIQWQ